ncbi:MAG: 16S rRNA (cytosine(1402)-N(4))-methyltransferase, partial [Actinomycetota bacterium]
CRCPQSLPCMCGAQPLVRNVRVPAKPTEEEQMRNRRSTSARLRVVEVL